MGMFSSGLGAGSNHVTGHCAFAQCTVHTETLAQRVAKLAGAQRLAPSLLPHRCGAATPRRSAST